MGDFPNIKVSSLLEDADIKSTHLTGAATLRGQNGKHYVALVTQPSGVERPLALIYDPEAAESLAHQLMVAASQAAILEVGAAPDEVGE